MYRKFKVQYFYFTIKQMNVNEIHYTSPLQFCSLKKHHEIRDALFSVGVFVTEASGCSSLGPRDFTLITCAYQNLNKVA